jgi:hypothetical protein
VSADLRLVLALGLGLAYVGGSLALWVALTASPLAPCGWCAK